MFNYILGDMERYYSRRPSLKDFLVFSIHPRTQAIAFFRMSQWCFKHRLRFLANVLETFNIILWGCELSPKMEIGKGFVIKHTLGVGLAFFSAGEDLTVNKEVNIGAAEDDPHYDRSKRPKIGNNVTIYISAGIFGDVTIGDNVIVGAHSLVLKSVPSNCVVAGSPARIIRHLAGYVAPVNGEEYCKDMTGQSKGDEG